MTAAILGLLFLVLLVLLLRFPARPLAIAASGIAALIAVAQLVLSTLPAITGGSVQPERAVSSLVLAGLLFSAAVASPPATRARKISRRRRATRDGSLAATSRQTSTSESDLSAYERQERVGIGGMASVYRAKRRNDGRTVALKIPQERFVVDAKFVRRFHREAEVLMRLDHPNIIKVYEHGSEGLTHYIAMEFVQGDSLEDLVDAHRLALRQAVEIMRCVVDALAYIHRQGIVHRDIKPGNIMVLEGALRDSPGQSVDPAGVKLMDFGIAAGKVLTRLTATGARVGTPVYMSPEQAKGQRIDHRSDIYSLGLVFYEMLVGQSAFKGTSEAVVHQQISQVPPPPRQVNHDVPQALSALVMRMIEKEPDRRATLSEIAETLSGSLLEESHHIEDPVQLALSVNARKGMLRFLDRSGDLLSTLGQSEGEDESLMAGAPTAISVEPDGSVLALLSPYASRSGKPLVARVATGGSVTSVVDLPGVPAVDIAVSPDGEFFVLFREDGTIRRYSADGMLLGSFGGRGTGRGTFERPSALVAGGIGHLYVLDYGNRQVQRFSLDGQYLNRYSLRLRADGTDLRVIDGIGVDRHGTVYISDAASAKIRTIKLDGTQGASLDLSPEEGDDQNAPLIIAIDPDDNVFAVRRGGHVIRRYDAQGRLNGKIDAYGQVLALSLALREPALVVPPTEASFA